MYFDLSKIGIYFDSIIVAGLVTGFLLNLLFHILKVKSNLSLVITSGILSSSYLLSNIYLDLSLAKSSLYLSWFFYDLFTIAVLFFGHFKLKLKRCTALYYVCYCLFFNSLLYLGIHTDLIILGNKEDWWFWSFYSAGILLSDCIMVVTVIINKDWLGVRKVSRKLYFKGRQAFG